MIYATARELKRGINANRADLIPALVRGNLWSE